MHNQLKFQRNTCDILYSNIDRLSSAIKSAWIKMYEPDKGFHGQSWPVTQILPTTNRNRMVQKLKEGEVIVQGLDPGAVTIDAVNSRNSKLLFGSLYRFTALQNNDEPVM